MAFVPRVGCRYAFEIDKRYRGSTGRTGKAAAILSEAAKKVEIQELKKNPGKDPSTLQALCSSWLDEDRVTRRDWRNDESRVRTLVGCVLVNGVGVPLKRWKLDGSIWVHDLTDEHLADLVEARREDGNTGATINREPALLQARQAAGRLGQGHPPHVDEAGLNPEASVTRKGKVTAHTFRHTFAARQLKAGASLFEVQILLGHSDPSTTAIYAHLDQQAGNRAASRLDGLHGVATTPPG